MDGRQMDDGHVGGVIGDGVTGGRFLDDRPGLERRLDDLLRPALLIEPPPDVQRSVLAAVLLATAARPGPAAPAPRAIPEEQPVPLATYLLLAGVLVAYVAAVSWLHGVVGNAAWLATLVEQLLAVAELLIGRPVSAEPLSLAWAVLQRAPWIALLPVGWLLWERDRSAARTA